MQDLKSLLPTAQSFVAVQSPTYKTVSISGKIDTTTEIMVSRLTGETVLNPDDTELQKKVLATFAMKLQRSDVTSKGSLFHGVACAVLQIAQEKGYTPSDLESACRKFLTTKQFGERIEPAHFFEEHTPEKFYPRSWYLKQLNDGGNGNEFDAYLLPGCSVAMYRRHDGRKLNIGTLVNFGGIAIPANVANGTSESRTSTRPQGETALKNDLSDVSTNYLLSKIDSLEFQLKQANRTIERQNAIIEKFKLGMEGDYAA